MLIPTRSNLSINYQEVSEKLREDFAEREELASFESIENKAEELSQELEITLEIKTRRNLIHEVQDAGQELLNSYLILTQDTEKKYQTPAAEWFLDNFHIIEDQIRSIRRDLPHHFYKELPKVKNGKEQGYPRVFVIAQLITTKCDSRLDIQLIERFINAYQKNSPLTIGELWALAINLRISLLKQLLPIVDRILASGHARKQANSLADEMLNMIVKHESPSERIVEKLSDYLCHSENFSRPFIVHLIQRLRDQDPEIFKSMEWLEESLAKCQTTTNDLIQLEHYRQAADQVSVGNIISSMRLFSKVDWHKFFEDVSLIDRYLNQDPTKEYPLMDLATRDSYRKVIEDLAKYSTNSELGVTKRILENAKAKELHIGHFIFDEGRDQIEKEIGFHKTYLETLRRLISKRPSYLYFGSILLLMAIIYAAIFEYLEKINSSLQLHLTLFALLLIPMSEFSIGLINYFITLIKKPKRLPKMDYRLGIPEQNRTMVVVPCLLTDDKTIKELVRNLEVQYLANQDENIFFALLGDYRDALDENLEEDKKLIQLARSEINELNNRYRNSHERFHLFYRKRIFNPAEEKWMGWERKRGKIQEFNHLLRGSKTTSYLPIDLPLDFLKSFKYVITLDADTQLPIQSAKKMIGTISHPLNRPVLDTNSGRVTKGFGIIQPRVSVSLTSAARTRFAQIFSGNTGIDPYTTAVSDVYQDLFGEGTYTGKGLYDIDVFEAALAGRIPENMILSHDLFEGSYARVGLATDIELIDDYPGDFATFCKRLHRWTRGDWQLFPWLFRKVPSETLKKVPNDLNLVARWKILDNLRRSLLAPMTLLWLVMAWTFLPGGAGVWTLGILLSMSCPVFASTIYDFIKREKIPWREHIKNNIRSLRNRIEQVFLMVVYLPEVSLAQIDAISRVFFRMFISKKKRLEWVTFSQVQNQKKEQIKWNELLTVGPFITFILSFMILYLRPESILVALPFFVTWLLTPYISYGTQRMIRPAYRPLDDEEQKQFRRYARLTWHFFEKFAVASENWLAPDNFQEDPKPVVAHRTSPTNIGLQLLSNLSAYDFGYIGMHDFIERTENVLNSIHKLEKLNGHLFNWYSTQTLEPLNPRYVSTVDSGNLAGHLITLKQACLELAKGNYKNHNAKKGVMDTLLILKERLHSFNEKPYLPRSGSLKRIINNIDNLTENLESVQWEQFLVTLIDSKKLLLDLPQEITNESTSNLHDWMECLTKQVDSFLKDEVADKNRTRLRLKTIAYQTHELAHEMDFKFLFDEERRIFVIGHNVTESRRDESYYDLLASESRLASFFAISKGDISDEHWFRLGRQLTTAVGSRALISWSATMFEYLMPLLVMKKFEETLLDQTYETIVRRQIEYAEQRQVPWGISEAGYNARDLQFNYQYGAFGIPGLGLKRGLKDELVVSPYSTMLAAMIMPRESLENLKTLEAMGALGDFGFYESIDYTPERIPKNKKSVILHSYMAHHQGMSLLSLNNMLNDSILQERFHADARNNAIQLLLQERIPAVIELAKPRAEETHIEGFSKLETDQQTRVYSDPSTPTPETQFITNGSYSVMVTSAGSGFSRCNKKMLNRWIEDPVMDAHGQYYYIRNLKSKKIWSSGFQPSLTKPKRYQAIFAEDRINIHREDEEIITNTEIIVSTEDNVEMRKISLSNKSNIDSELELTSYMEVVLRNMEDDSAHPAFSKLFIQTEFIPEYNAILAKRRARTSEEKEIWGFHLVTSESHGPEEIEFETDRSVFLGRGRTIHNPVVMSDFRKLTNTEGAVLDPIFAIRKKTLIRSKETNHIIFASGICETKEQAIQLIAKYADPNIFTRETNLGWVKSQINLRHLNISMARAHLYQRMGSHIIYLSPFYRAQSALVKTNKKQQSALWSHGISGDYPIILVRLHDEKDVSFVREILHAHEYLRLKGLLSDLVILNEHKTTYLQTLQDEIMRQILISGGHLLLDRPGGIFIKRADIMDENDLNLLKTLSRIQFRAELGGLEEQLNRSQTDRSYPPLLIKTKQEKSYLTPPLLPPKLMYYNSFGGFSEDGAQYILHLKKDLWPSAPWINVISNTNQDGFTISESGQGFTWSENSRENRISPWRNDPVSDSVSEAVYLRDELTGEFWSPTPLPIREDEDYIVHHTQGFTTIRHNSHGLSQTYLAFTPIHQSLKIVRITIKNETQDLRRISLTHYLDLVLGAIHQQSSATLWTEWDQEMNALTARNSYNNEFSEKIIFLNVNQKFSSFTCDRKEFLGRNGNFLKPDSLLKQNLSGRQGGNMDQCFALQLKLDLNPAEEKEIIFLLGAEENKELMKQLIERFQRSEEVSKSLNEVISFWTKTLETIQIHTPDPTMDILVNHWLLYQTLSCRYWARSALYQSGGAYGFRDQLQDVMALVYTHPEITRAQIIRAASRQFVEGDVQHWWHPPTGRGVRTRFSDDLLWLPFALSYYLQVTQDFSLLKEMIPYLEAPQLPEGVDECYSTPSLSREESTLYDHCNRAIERSLKVGNHGLPLMGSGDWNDGMNRVGHEGFGESVWMGWFLCATLDSFLPLCEFMKDEKRHYLYRDHIDKLKKSIESNAWDGEWYLRAFYDNGESLGSHQNEECKIDSIAQSWAILSGKGNLDRSKQAMEAVDRNLIDRKNKIIKLFYPPFDKTKQDPGYIKGYVPGVRENGGQYTHAAIWTMMAFAKLKDHQRAYELFSMLNPINHTLTRDDALKYKVEPYVMSADIYGVEPHIGRGGWSWYTGSSSWMYRAAIESILGFTISDGKIVLDPCIPNEWREFNLTYKKENTIINIQVMNRGLESKLVFDGVEMEGSSFTIPEDGETHQAVYHLKNNHLENLVSLT